MNSKRIIGLLVVIAGVLLILLSFYTNSQVDQEVGQAKAKVSTMTSNPVTQMGGKPAQATGQVVQQSANQAINEKAMPYTQMAMWELYGGIALVIVGGAYVLFSRRK